MTAQQTPASKSVDLESSERALASGGSTTSNILEDRSSEKKESEEIAASPVAPTPGAGDFPDGGFAAWCVVLGVSQLAFSSFLVGENLIQPWSRSLHVPFSQRGLHF